MAYTTFSVDSPICKFDVDREKVKQLGVELSDVFTALQVNYGGAYINDFVRFGRSYYVMLQSDDDGGIADDGSPMVSFTHNDPPPEK